MITKPIRPDPGPIEPVLLRDALETVGWVEPSCETQRLRKRRALAGGTAIGAG
ncbi:MAG TPA: hypothetical protein VJ045_05575 [Hyphomicrobiaceae bacterium]|nr:hypothetical protein [Hyphomicrobiaceae bacterium]